MKMIGAVKKLYKKGDKVYSRGRLHLDVLVEKDGNHFIAHCLDLDIVAQGKTEPEARNNLIELIRDQIEFAVENDLEQLLVHPAPPEYWKKFYNIKSVKLRKVLARNPPSSKAEIGEKLDVAYA